MRLTWTAEQALTFLAFTASDDLSAFWQLALYFGMRRGEMLTLPWADVDFERGAISVRRTLTRGEDGLMFGEPKSAAGRRSVAIPPALVASLGAHRARQAERRPRLGPAWQDHDLIFERGDGTVLHSNNVTHAFPRLVKGLNNTIPADEQLPVIRLHDLRHTTATLMLANREHPEFVQERLGHFGISMTLNRYSHVTMDMQREAADRLERLLAT
jgi:integrase